MIFNILLRDNQTGKTKAVEHEADAWADIEYLWTEGNYACDCNRGLLFNRVRGVEDVPRACGSEQFDIIEVTGPDGFRVTPEVE
ncbi:hypothetical protein CPT_Sonora_074 [Stenotrophomonas phage Sonora]|nr:hypothetical protein CPT_Sonora_074 [Stenotrophomonas phage Sonora]